MTGSECLTDRCVSLPILENEVNGAAFLELEPEDIK